MKEQNNTNLVYGYPEPIHKLAENYISKEILKCDSSLVDALMNWGDESNIIGQNFNYDRVENIYYISPKWISDLTSEEQALLKLYNFRTMEDFSDYMDDCETSDKAYDSNGNDLTIENAEHFAALEEIHYVWKHRDSEAQEVFEWWSITKWLAKQLISLGEPVLDNDYGYWWGRTCTGQSIILDGTIQKIAMQYSLRLL